MPEHPFPPAEQRGDGLVARANRDALPQREIAARLKAQHELARLGPEFADATFDGVTDGHAARAGGDTGPEHEPMVPYATPTLEARAAAGRNAAYEEAIAASEVARRGAEEEELLPFFAEFR